MSIIIINGNSYSGNNICVSGNKVIINGKDVTPDSKNINITVNGNITELNVDCCEKLEVIGTVGSIKTKSGDVDCGNVEGSVQTMSGDVDCMNVSGGVSTMSGDIKYKKS